jgi:hypothetical protein
MKKIIGLQKVVIAVLACLVTGCSVYTPTCTDIPLIREKGEMQIEGAVVAADEVALRATVAYGFTDHFAAAASIDPQRRYYQALAGAYFPVGDRFVWELYGGAGYGRGYNYRDSDPGLDSYGRHWLVFVQADAGWQNLTRFLNMDIAFSLKTGYMNRDLNVGDGTVMVTDTVSGITQWYGIHHYAEEHCLLVEPTVEVRFGWEHFKFNVKAGYAHLFGSKEGQYAPLSFGVGMSYRFNARNKR